MDTSELFDHQSILDRIDYLELEKNKIEDKLDYIHSSQILLALLTGSTGIMSLTFSDSPICVGVFLGGISALGITMYLDDKFSDNMIDIIEEKKSLIMKKDLFKNK